MRILWVKAGGLVPADTGGKIRSFNILRQLAGDNPVTLFSFYGFHEHDQHPDLDRLFHRVVCTPLPLPEPRSLSELRDYGLSLFSSQPYNICKFCRPEARRALEALIGQESYDVIVCDFLVAAGVIPWDAPVAKVLFAHNVEATIWRRHYEIANISAWKGVSWLEWRRMRAAERHYLNLADCVFAVSDADRNDFSEFVKRENISVIPTGVDIDFFQPMPANESANSLVFTGSMDWLPNEDGMIYFLDAILPLLQQDYPQLTLEIVGRNPSQKLMNLVGRHRGVRLTGWVDDIRPFLARAAVAIVPLRIGGGTRLKIFEAMAMGKAIVSTSIGAEGLPVRDGKHICLSDTPHAFAHSVISLLRNDGQRKLMGDAARKLVEERYSWQNVARTFVTALESVVAQKRASAVQASALG